MANEITSGPGDTDGNYPLLFIIPIPTPKVWNSGINEGQNVVPTPSSTLPDWGVDILAQAEKDSLDAGTSLFMVYIFRTNGLTGPQMIAKAQLLYTQESAKALADYAKIYKYPGNRISAT